MLSKIWNRDKFYTCLKLTHDAYNTQINGMVDHGPYRCCVDDSERRLFKMYLGHSLGYMLSVTSGMRMTVFEATGINRALHRRGIKFEVYR